MEEQRGTRVKKAKTRGARTLSIAVGGAGLKASVLDEKGKMVVPRVWAGTPYPCSPKVLVNALAGLAQPLPEYDRVAVGFPGYVRENQIITAPEFGNDLWKGFDLAEVLGKELGKPVHLLNDADMQGFAAIKGKGLELVITLGTGVGTGLFRDGELMPHLELAHHPLRRGKTYNEYLGKKALRQVGAKKWNRRLQRVLGILHDLLHPDALYLGGGNSRRISFKLPPNIHLISNEDGILGGFMAWEPLSKSR